MEFLIDLDKPIKTQLLAGLLRNVGSLGGRTPQEYAYQKNYGDSDNSTYFDRTHLFLPPL
jgi:hypothetical protein